MGYCGGGDQSLYFAIGAFSRIRIDLPDEIYSVLDYGCGSGGSCPALNMFFPNATIYVYDVSEYGVKNAIRKYSRFIPVKPWDNKQKELVYCSNVIEHIASLADFVKKLIDSSNKYILIQCPWNELHPSGNKITPDFPHGEHIWTIDDEFLRKHIFVYQNIEWTKVVGKVEMSWPNGEQLYLFGKIKL